MIFDKPLAIVLLALMVTSIGCQKTNIEPVQKITNQEQSGAERTNDGDQHASVSEEFAGQSRDRYVQTMQIRLTEVNQQISELETKVESLDEQQREIWTSRLGRLQQLRNDFQSNLDQLRSEPLKSWKRLAREVQESSSAVDRAVVEAVEQID